jgi:hypothetical protein
VRVACEAIDACSAGEPRRRIAGLREGEDAPAALIVSMWELDDFLWAELAPWEL